MKNKLRFFFTLDLCLKKGMIVIMEDNENKNVVFTNPGSYKKVPDFDKKEHNFTKSVFLPFLSGLLGAVLVIGVCFGVPTVRDKIFSISNINTPSSSSKEDDTSSTNLNLVSLSNYSDTSVSVAEKVLPSIVGIQVEYSVRSFWGGNSNATAQGSGIIISEDGYILTNNHIVSSSTSSSSFYEISDANKVTVYLYNDDTEYEATIIGKDEQTDLAVIKIDKTGLTKATLGDSSKTKVGEFAMAVGNPLGLQSSVTCGVISAIDREVTDSDGKTYKTIQTDAAINSGNSGGALVNSNGEVIGINTLKLSGTGIEGMGFAIPISSTIDIYEELIQYNKVRRPYIGITGLDLDEKTADYNDLPIGIYVRDVEDFSAAQIAGVKVGDVIIKADGKDIKTMDELDEIKFSHEIGEQMTLIVVRDGEEKEITLTLKEQP